MGQIEFSENIQEIVGEKEYVKENFGLNVSNLYIAQVTEEKRKAIIDALKHFRCENIRVQTMAGCEQKAKEGKWRTCHCRG